MFAQFYFWFSFSLGYKYTYFGKFFYSIWNGPQIPLITDILIRYFKTIGRDEYILVGTSSVGLLKHLMNAVSGTFVGVAMETKTQEMSWICECTIMYAIGISFFADIMIEKILVKKKLNIYEDESGSGDGKSEGGSSNGSSYCEVNDRKNEFIQSGK